MYKQGIRKKPHRKRYLLLLLVVAAAGFGGYRAAKNYFTSTTVITDAPPVVHTVGADSSASVKFNEGIFSLSLPKGWKKLAGQNSYGAHSWKELNGKTSRQLDVYIDDIPTTLGVNKMLPVEAAGDGVKISGELSDNCSNFTKPSSSQNSLSVSAKWEGANFYCDLANFELDVSGTSSLEGPNSVTVTGASGPHRVFFAYTDNSVNPDYGDFYAALQSFHIK